MDVLGKVPTNSAWDTITSREWLPDVLGDDRGTVLEPGPFLRREGEDWGLTKCVQVLVGFKTVPCLGVFHRVLATGACSGQLNPHMAAARMLHVCHVCRGRGEGWSKGAFVVKNSKKNHFCCMGISPFPFGFWEKHQPMQLIRFGACHM